jgi:thiamine monophosphate synthase
LENLLQARAAGVRRILMVSAWLEADDIAGAVQAARRLLNAE